MITLARRPSNIRNPKHADDVSAVEGEPLLCDLKEASAKELADAIGSPRGSLSREISFMISP